MRSICRRAMAGLKATAIIPRPGQAFHPQTSVRPPAKVLARRRFLKFAAGAAALPAMSRIARASVGPPAALLILLDA